MNILLVTKIMMLKKTLKLNTQTDKDINLPKYIMGVSA